MEWAEMHKMADAIWKGLKLCRYEARCLFLQRQNETKEAVSSRADGSSGSRGAVSKSKY